MGEREVILLDRNGRARLPINMNNAQMFQPAAMALLQQRGNQIINHWMNGPVGMGIDAVMGVVDYVAPAAAAGVVAARAGINMVDQLRNDLQVEDQRQHYNAAKQTSKFKKRGQGGIPKLYHTDTRKRRFKRYR